MWEGVGVAGRGGRQGAAGAPAPAPAGGRTEGNLWIRDLGTGRRHRRERGWGGEGEGAVRSVGEVGRPARSCRRRAGGRRKGSVGGGRASSPEEVAGR